MEKIDPKGKENMDYSEFLSAIDDAKCDQLNDAEDEILKFPSENIIKEIEI